MPPKGVRTQILIETVLYLTKIKVTPYEKLILLTIFSA